MIEALYNYIIITNFGTFAIYLMLKYANSKKQNKIINFILIPIWLPLFALIAIIKESKILIVKTWNNIKIED